MRLGKIWDGRLDESSKRGGHEPDDLDVRLDETVDAVQISNTQFALCLDAFLHT